jgi:hypothetical protein
VANRAGASLAAMLGRRPAEVNRQPGPQSLGLSFLHEDEERQLAMRSKDEYDVELRPQAAATASSASSSAAVPGSRRSSTG